MKVNRGVLFYLILCLLLRLFSCQQPDDPIIEEEFDWQKALIKSEIPLYEDNEPECIGSPRIDHEQPYDPEMYREQHLDNTAKIFDIRFSKQNPALVAYQCHYPIYTKEGHFNGYEGALFTKNTELNITRKLVNDFVVSFQIAGENIYYTTGTIFKGFKTYKSNINKIDQSELLNNGLMVSVSPDERFISYYENNKYVIYDVILGKNVTNEKVNAVRVWIDDSCYLQERGNMLYKVNFFTDSLELLGASSNLTSKILEISPNLRFVSDGRKIHDLKTNSIMYLPEKIKMETGWCWNNFINSFTFLPDNRILGVKVLYYPDNETMEAKVTYHLHIFSGPDFATETHVELNLETER